MDRDGRPDNQLRESQDRTSPVFRRAKALVGLDIGSSAVKAVELKPAGKGYKVTGVRQRAGAARQHRRRRHHRRRAPSPTPSAGCSTSRGIKTKDVAASLSGNAVIVKKITLPVMTEAELAESIYWEAEQYIPFDIQDVNLDYQILDSGDRRRRQGDDGRPARRGEEGKDRRLHRRHRPGRADRRWSSTSTPSRCRTPTRSTTASSPSAVVVLLNAGASATNINILQRRPVGLHPRHLDRRQRLHRGAAAGAEPAVRDWPTS